MEQVVSQHQGGRTTGEIPSADQESLSKPVRTGLRSILKGHPPLGSISQEPFKGGCVVGRGDDQNITDARQHQSAKRVINHRFVIDGKQLFADRLRDWVEASAASSGKDDATSCEVGLSQEMTDDSFQYFNIWTSCIEGGCDGVQVNNKSTHAEGNTLHCRFLRITLDIKAFVVAAGGMRCRAA